MSERKISRLRHKLFGRLTAFNGQNGFDVDIYRDLLHRRYAVNRHGIEVKGNRNHVIDLRNLFCQSLLAEGWIFSQKYGHDIFSVMFEGSRMAVWVSNVQTNAGMTRFDVNPGIERG